MAAFSVCRVGVAVLVWLALSLPSHAQNRIALVIGNSRYVNVKMLANPASDAIAVAAMLRQANFSVVAANDLGAVDMKRAFRDFAEKSRKADVAVVYYAGHGIEFDGTNYLLPVDTVLKRDSDVEDEAISLDRVVKTLDQAKRLRLIILDACRDNPFARTARRTIETRSLGQGLAKVEPLNSNTLIAFAAKAGSTAADGDDQHSPFTTSLLKHLTTPGLDLRMALGRVRDEVMEATDNRQEPFVYGSLGGSVVSLVPEPKKVVVAAPPPNPNADARRDYELAKEIGTREAWDSFLADYPTGLYANFARAARRKLDDEEAERHRRDASEKAQADKVQRDAVERARQAAAEKEKAQREEAAERARQAAAKAAADKAAAEAAAKAAAEKAAAEKSATQQAATPKAPEKVASAGHPIGTSGSSGNAPRDARFFCGPASRLARVTVGGHFTPISIRVNPTGAKEIRAAAISPNGSEIASAGDDGLIRIWDAVSFKLIRILKGHRGEIYSIDYSPDGSLMASASWDGTVNLWNSTSDRPLHTFEALSTDGYGGPIKQYSVAFYPVSPLKYLASSGEDGHVRIWDLQRKELARTRLDHQVKESDKSVVRSITYAPNGSGEFVTAGFDGKVRFYRTEGGRIDVKDAHGRKAIRVAYSPDGTRVLSTGSEIGRPSQNLGYLKLWNTKSQTSRPLVGHGDYVVSASWSSDGMRIASGGGGQDKTVRLWDSDSGRQLAAFAGHAADIEAVIFDGRRSRLISVSEDKTMKVWDIAEKKEILTAVAFGERDYVAYTPEGCYTGSNGIESRLSVFDGTTAKPLTDDIKASFFVPDGFVSLQ